MPVTQETLRKVEAKLAETFVTRDEIRHINEWIADQKAASFGILHNEYKDGAFGPKLNFCRVVYGEIFRRKHGTWPAGRDAAEAREYRLAEQYVSKALGSSTDTAGGFAIPEEWEDGLIETLKARSIVFEMGPDIKDTRRDVLNVPAFDAKKTYAWVAENTSASEQSPTTRNIPLTPKKVIGLAAMSNEWLEDADDAANESLRQELLGALAEFVDEALLQGSGANRPTGLRDISGITEIASVGALTFDHLTDAQFRLKSDNVRPPYVWLGHPKAEKSIQDLKDSDGRPLFLLAPQFGNQIKPLGHPFLTSTQVATDEGVSSDETYLLLVKPADVIVARRRGINIAVSEHAGFSSDQTQLRLTARFDVALKHVESVVLLSGII
jgi:HK97 family phage major capsid protein